MEILSPWGTYCGMSNQMQEMREFIVPIANQSDVAMATCDMSFVHSACTRFFGSPAQLPQQLAFTSCPECTQPRNCDPFSNQTAVPDQTLFPPSVWLLFQEQLGQHKAQQVCTSSQVQSPRMALTSSFSRSLAYSRGSTHDRVLLVVSDVCGHAMA